MFLRKTIVVEIHRIQRNLPFRITFFHFPVKIIISLVKHSQIKSIHSNSTFTSPQQFTLIFLPR